MKTENTATVEVTNLEDIVAAAKIMSRENIPELLEFARQVEIQIMEQWYEADRIPASPYPEWNWDDLLEAGDLENLYEPAEPVHTNPDATYEIPAAIQMEVDPARLHYLAATYWGRATLKANRGRDKDRAEWRRLIGEIADIEGAFESNIRVLPCDNLMALYAVCCGCMPVKAEAGGFYLG